MEVQLRIQKALFSLARLGPVFAQEAKRHSASALARAELALKLPADLDAVRSVAAEVAATAGGKALQSELGEDIPYFSSRVQLGVSSHYVQTPCASSHSLHYRKTV